MQPTGKDRRYLRALGNPLKPVVWIGKEGLTPAIRRSIEEAHQGSELIKVKILDPGEHDRKEIAAALERGLKSLVGGMIGGTYLLYRRNEEKPVIELPSQD